MSFEPCSTEAQNCLPGDAPSGSSSPIGFLDFADSTGRVIGGWSLDKDAPYASNEVHIYIDGPAGSPNATGFVTVADKPRQDVNTVTGYPGNHGYEFQVPEQFADGKPHTVYAYGIDVSGGNQPSLLTNSPKSILLAPTTKVTTFEYDALGNRKKMTDETGVSTYEYDSLSRVKTENKHLRDDWNIARHDFGVQYDYNLTGSLKSVTDPFGQTIDYGTDKAGRLKTISGSPFNSTDGTGTAAVTDYINNIEYRAWGGVKSIDYGNTTKMSQAFDSRLRVSEFNVWKDGQSASYIKKAYQYYDDNRLKFSDDTGDTFMRADSHRFDRSYKYDFMGRLSEARTGIEARGGAATDRSEVPYKQDYSYNAFGNVTSRQTFAWTQADNQTNNWGNNRETTWSYDADGRLKHTPENNYDYDAAGSLIVVALEGARVSYQQADGESKAVRRDMYRIGSGNGFHTFEKTEYTIYSSVLGKPLAEVKADGTRKRTFVYGMNGVVVAVQNAVDTVAQHVAWEHIDPSKASYISTTHGGQAIYSSDNPQAELDPLGSNVGTQSPQTEQMGSGGGWGYGAWGDPFGGYSCRVDGVETPCVKPHNKLVLA